MGLGVWPWNQADTNNRKPPKVLRFDTYCCWFRNPANQLRLVALSQYLQGFAHRRWLFRISEHQQYGYFPAPCNFTPPTHNQQILIYTFQNLPGFHREIFNRTWFSPLKAPTSCHRHPPEPRLFWLGGKTACESNMETQTRQARWICNL